MYSTQYTDEEWNNISFKKYSNFTNLIDQHVFVSKKFSKACIIINWFGSYDEVLRIQSIFMNLFSDLFNLFLGDSAIFQSAIHQNRLFAIFIKLNLKFSRSYIKP